jgi:hypothetical protein
MALGLTRRLTEMSTRKYFWEIKPNRHVRLTTSPLFVSQLSTKCGILDTSRLCIPPRPASRDIFILLLNHSQVDLLFPNDV